MRWRHTRRSSNVKDIRGGSGGFGARGGLRLPGSFSRGGGRLRLPLPGGRRTRRGGIGLGGLILIGIVFLIFGGDPSSLLQMLGGGGMPAVSTGGRQPVEQPLASDDTTQMVAAVLADTEATWHEIFEAGGATYREPTLVLFNDQVRSACGSQSAAVGPFYCPGDQQVYLDTVFFDELARRLGAPGDFAQAYVVAHEVGHHVQNLLGISQEVQAARRQVSRAEGNELSVRLELQADCFAGIWAHGTTQGDGIEIERGDLEEALQAASAIGDDTLQRRSQGRVVPDSFTHGTSEQRMRWFETGFRTGSVEACDTFSVATP